MLAMAEPPRKRPRAEEDDGECRRDDRDAQKKPTMEPSPLGRRLFPGCRHITEFEKLNVIDEGTFGCVFRYRDKRNGEVVALKKIKMESGQSEAGFPLTSLREGKLLMQFKHENIVNVTEIVVGKGLHSVYMAMEFLEHDLRTLMEDMKGPFLGAEVKCVLQQLLRGVAHLHANWILHRDLKTANLLLSNKGVLKIADFGSARNYGSPQGKLTGKCTTLWYQAPEMLLGSRHYTTAVDMWAVGCIFAELTTQSALFPGQGEINMLSKVFSTLGTPTEETWPGLNELPAMKKFTYKTFEGNHLRSQVPGLTNAGFDLLSRMLEYDPAKRITAQAALEHPYFEESPRPQHPSMMPTFPSRAEGAARRKRTYEDYLMGNDVSDGVTEGLLNDNMYTSGAGFQLK